MYLFYCKSLLVDNFCWAFKGTILKSRILHPTLLKPLSTIRKLLGTDEWRHESSVNLGLGRSKALYNRRKTFENGLTIWS